MPDLALELDAPNLTERALVRLGEGGATIQYEWTAADQQAYDVQGP